VKVKETCGAPATKSKGKYRDDNMLRIARKKDLRKMVHLNGSTLGKGNRGFRAPLRSRVFILGREGERDTISERTTRARPESQAPGLGHRRFATWKEKVVKRDHGRALNLRKMQFKKREFAKEILAKVRPAEKGDLKENLRPVGDPIKAETATNGERIS